MAQTLVAMEGVKSIAVLVMGDTVLVGVETDAGLSAAEALLLRTRIEQKVLGEDQSIRRCAVTSDSSLLNNIRTMATDITSGRLNSGMATQFNSIYNTISK